MAGGENFNGGGGGGGGMGKRVSVIVYLSVIRGLRGGERGKGTVSK